MAKLKPKYIVVHTAAYGGTDCDRNLIDRWHREKGWDGIGYHYVIVNDRHSRIADGTVQEGRDIAVPGAHVQGLNSQSIGICCVGNGDKETFTDAQSGSLVQLISRLIDDHEEVTVERVIGHREVNRLIAEGLVKSEYKTDKSCPGKLIDPAAIRDQVRAFRAQAAPRVETKPEEIPNEEEVRAALSVLERSRPRFPNAGEHLTGFLCHPEVLELLAQTPEP